MVQCCFTSTETVGSNRRRLSRQREIERTTQRERDRDRETETDREKETHRERQIHTDRQPIETESGNKKTIGRDKPTVERDRQTAQDGHLDIHAPPELCHSEVGVRLFNGKPARSIEATAQKRRRRARVSFRDDGQWECRVRPRKPLTGGCHPPPAGIM